MKRSPAILAILFPIFLVACGSPSAQPPVSPAVNLTGEWVVVYELEGYVLDPVVWIITQSGSSVEVRNPDVIDIPCGNETSEIQGNRWIYSASFDASNCPVFNPLGGHLSFDALASNTAFGGSITLRITSPAAAAGTYRGRIIGVKQ